MGRMANKTHTATIHTNHGDIVVELFGNHAPKTVKNFVGLATGEQEWTLSLIHISEPTRRS